MATLQVNMENLSVRDLATAEDIEILRSDIKNLKTEILLHLAQLGSGTILGIQENSEEIENNFATKITEVKDLILGKITQVLEYLDPKAKIKEWSQSTKTLTSGLFKRNE